jgi:hypothetical protein
MTRISTITVSPKEAGSRRPPAGQNTNDVRVDLNERCFLFPSGKGVSHVVLAPQTDPAAVEMRAVFAFNQSRADSTIDRFTLDEARILARAMVDGIYQARTQTAFLNGRSIALVCNTNGFVMVGHEDAYSLFVSGQILITVAQGLLRAVDRVAPTEAH